MSAPLDLQSELFSATGGAAPRACRINSAARVLTASRC
jgi:hypothetical protein